MKKSDLGVSVMMICVGMAALIKATEFPKQSQMMPYIYSSALIILSLFLGVKALRNRGKVEKEDSLKKRRAVVTSLVGSHRDIYVRCLNSNTWFLFIYDAIFVYLYGTHEGRSYTCLSCYFSCNIAGGILFV